MQATTSPRLALNGTAPAKTPRRQRSGKQAVNRPTLARFKVGMTVVLGIGIPCLSLAMSKLAGTLASAGIYPLALFAFALMLAVLGVSLSHLAWAVSDITRSGLRASWALAVALDLSLVLCEMCLVSASTLDLAWVCYTVMTAVAVCSMALNVYAFLRH